MHAWTHSHTHTHTHTLTHTYTHLEIIILLQHVFAYQRVKEYFWMKFFYHITETCCWFWCIQRVQTKINLDCDILWCCKSTSCCLFVWSYSHSHCAFHVQNILNISKPTVVSQASKQATDLPAKQYTNQLNVELCDGRKKEKKRIMAMSITNSKWKPPEKDIPTDCTIN